MNKYLKEALPALIVGIIIVMFMILVISGGKSAESGSFQSGTKTSFAQYDPTDNKNNISEGFDPWVLEEQKIQGYPIWRAKFGNYLTKGMANDMTYSWTFR
jgi:hypothetical protein